MAKSKLPSVDDVAPIAAPAQPAELDVSTATEDNSSGRTNRGFKEDLRGYRGVDVRLKKMSHKIALRDKFRQLEDANATLADGSPVQCKADVIRWMLENIDVA